MSVLENLQLACAVCKIGTYTLWQRLCCRKPAVPRPEVSVVCLGLTKAGKTTLLTLLSEEDTSQIEPTTGFMIKALQFPECIMHVKEIGGGDKVRPFWKHYYAGAEGIVFVVDSAASGDDMDDAREALQGALSHSALTNLPCLILANCQDKQDARTKVQISDDLDLEKACVGRSWSLVLCSTADIGALREELSMKFIPFLVPQTETSKLNLQEDKNRV